LFVDAGKTDDLAYKIKCIDDGSSEKFIRNINNAFLPGQDYQISLVHDFNGHDILVDGVSLLSDSQKSDFYGDSTCADQPFDSKNHNLPLMIKQIDDSGCSNCAEPGIDMKNIRYTKLFLESRSIDGVRNAQKIGYLNEHHFIRSSVRQGCFKKSNYVNYMDMGFKNVNFDNMPVLFPVSEIYYDYSTCTIVGKCRSFCYGHGFKFAAVSFENCLCGDSILHFGQGGVF